MVVVPWKSRRRRQGEKTPYEDSIHKEGNRCRADRFDCTRRCRPDERVEALGVDEDALSAARESGQSLAEIAEANGGDIDAVIAILIEHKTDRIQTAVENGRLTQAEADEMIASLEERVTERVNAAPGERGQGRNGRHRGGN